MYRLTNTREFAVITIVQSNGEATSVPPFQSVDVSHLTKNINLKIAAGDLTMQNITDTSSLQGDEALDLVDANSGTGSSQTMDGGSSASVYQIAQHVDGGIADSIYSV